MNKLSLRQSIITGVVAGIIFAALSFGTYYTSLDSFFSFKMIYNVLPIATIIIIIMGFNLRKKLGGFMSFKEVLQFAMVAYLSFEIISAITNYLLFVVLDPALTEKMKNKGLQFAQQMLANSGKSQEEIDKGLGAARNQKETTEFKRNIFLGFGMYLVLDFLLSMLIAVIIKKDRPADLDYPQPVA